MNSLSWLLYLADVAETAKPAFVGIAGAIGGLGGLFIAFFWFCAVIDSCKKGPIVIATIVWAIISLPSFTLALVIPSKDTIYLIAASEAGGVVVQSDEAKEIMSGLKTIIKDQISKNLPVKP